MKITRIRTVLYEAPLARRLGDANSPGGRDWGAAVAMFVDTDDGLTGVSIAPPGAQRDAHALADALLLGQDPRGVRGLWKRMVDRVFKGGNVGAVGGAISALDVALWDLKAKAHEEPLWRTLGATSRRVPAYASGIDMPLADDELAAFYEGMARMGVAAGKLKVGLDEDTDLRRIGVMRNALAKSGRKPVLLVDSNEYWSPKQAIRHLRRYEEQYDITWAEEPARRWDYRGLRRVSRGIRAAVASGENLDNIGQFMPLLANEAIDVVQVGMGTTGITGALQVAHMALGFELPVSMMNCPGNLMAHLAAALPNHMMMEVVAAETGRILRADNHLEAGHIVLGDQPGHGLSFDEDSLAAAAVDAVRPGAGPSPWGRRRGAGLYEVPVREEGETGDCT
jgi:L-alanine-DL-glutamate epimerase-like enolase superfamily enzyme